eukprot:COSAG04_NODE_1891_length_5294_cov_3.885659_4_plen_138_part_00
MPRRLTLVAALVRLKTVAAGSGADPLLEATQLENKWDQIRGLMGELQEGWEGREGERPPLAARPRSPARPHLTHGGEFSSRRAAPANCRADRASVANAWPRAEREGQEGGEVAAEGGAESSQGGGGTAPRVRRRRRE